MDESTAFLSNLRWARIRVKWNGKTPPPYVEVFEGQSIYDIQLWWEIQPFVRSVNALTDMVAGTELREDEEEGAHARESVGYPSSRREKIDGTEDVPSSRENQTGFLAQKVADKSDLMLDQTRGRVKTRALPKGNQG